MNNGQIYSREKLTQMMDQNESEVNELMGIFIRMVPEMLVEMQNYANEDDWSGAGDVAHKLKSSMRLWDMHSLEEDILFIEGNAKVTQDKEIVLGKILNVKEQLLNAIEEMKVEIGFS